MAPDLDDLLARLRARAADPDRRTSSPPSRLLAGARALDLGGLVAMTRQVTGDLTRAVEATRAGRVDPGTRARSEQLRDALESPAPSVLPAPADEAAITAAEAALGIRLPAALRRVYGEVADGGFGPGEGILPLSDVVAAQRRLAVGDELPRGRSWPPGLLPLVDTSGGWYCVDAGTGRVVSFDPDGLGERSGEARFREAFREIAPSVEAWLDEWVGSRTAAEQLQADRLPDAMAAMQVAEARRARAMIAAMAPAERAAMGLPEAGWERIVWGGLGWDEDGQGAGDGEAQPDAAGGTRGDASRDAASGV